MAKATATSDPTTATRTAADGVPEAGEGSPAFRPARRWVALLALAVAVLPMGIANALPIDDASKVAAGGGNGNGNGNSGNGNGNGNSGSRNGNGNDGDGHGNDTGRDDVGNGSVAGHGIPSVSPYQKHDAIRR